MKFVADNLRRVLMAAVSGLLAYGGAALWFHLNPVHYHRIALRLVVHEPANRLTGDYILWSVQGRRSLRQIEQVREEHLEALAKLGFFETRRFRLREAMNEDRLAVLLSMVRQWQTENRFTDAHGRFEALNHGTELLVTAVPEDVPAWTELVREFGKKE